MTFDDFHDVMKCFDIVYWYTRCLVYGIYQEERSNKQPFKARRCCGGVQLRRCIIRVDHILTYRQQDVVYGVILSKEYSTFSN